MLYKQGIQKIEIIVRKDIGSGAPGTNALSTQKANTQQIDSTDLGNDIDETAGIKQKTLRRFVGSGLVQLGKQVVFKGFDYYVSGIGMATGDQALQAQIGRKIEVIKDVVHFGTFVTSGTAVGAMFGPVGTVLGAAIGIAGAGMSLAFRQAERERSYNYEMFKSDNQLQYLRSRAELNLTTGRWR